MSALPHPAPTRRVATAWPLRGLRQALASQRELTLLALFMWAAMLPALVALGLDARELRGVSVWLKPLKFMASVGLFSFTTAWFIGLLPQQRRKARPVRWIVATIIVSACFEVGYITLQAALGRASHYNYSDTLHGALYTAMGVFAMAMTATQPLLAWQIARHGRTEIEAGWRRAVVVGLVLTFLLGAGTGGLLGSFQAPVGPGLPLLGWHLGGGDLRPAHFLGLHAQQLIPLGALAFSGLAARAQRWALLLYGCAYVGLWVAAMQLGLHGAVLTLPPR